MAWLWLGWCSIFTELSSPCDVGLGKWVSNQPRQGIVGRQHAVNRLAWLCFFLFSLLFSLLFPDRGPPVAVMRFSGSGPIGRLRMGDQTAGEWGVISPTVMKVRWGIVRFVRFCEILPCIL